jgi:hypothetical protein
MRAIDTAPIEELRAKYGDIRKTEGWFYSEKLMPSIIFKPKEDTEGFAIQRIVVTPCLGKVY